MFLTILGYLSSTWVCLYIFGFLLIYLRSDSAIILADIGKMLSATSFFGKLWALLTLFILIPFSIPYTIAKLIKQRNDS